MKHEGKALAADETDTNHHRSPGVASVHVRAILTWCAIFPMVAIGMTAMGSFAQEWHPVLRALVLTLVVVPMAVYVVVPRLLLLHGRLSRAAHDRKLRREDQRVVRKPRRSTSGS
ncbi:hypothetical protein [Paeniglutamicibacter sp. NPDC091659]|uniref:hypothetical protein n=1 Tax=Paeniglutamicibacter sp. NPDC091659 TaxID=3364389 RepID=UPI00380CE63E